jgi:hypothetical protein
MVIFSTTALLLAGTWWIGHIAGISMAVFVLMLVVLPWWVFQCYASGLTGRLDATGLSEALRCVGAQAHDVRYLGALFFLTAFTDLYIIVVNPEYGLTIFCTKPAGMLGMLAKAQSPTLHLLIGYGFMRLRRWGLLVYMVYAAFGFINALTNFACFGYGRVRTIFLITLTAFTAYVIWRRRCFR